MKRKEAIEVIKKNWPNSSFTMLREALETLIPELAESEDEKIRNFLIKQANSVLDSITDDDEEVPAWKSALAWLEKKGINNMGISEATKQELEDNLNKALEKETPESWNKFLDEQGEQKMKTPEESLDIDSDTYNKIVDECIYGEQKPTELPKGEDYGIDGLYAAIDILQKTLGEVDGYQSDDGILTHKCAISAVKELSKQKSAWGEEDIELLDNTIKFIEDRVAATSPSLRTYSPTLTGKEIPFLKALKDRVQPKQEWSEEDVAMLDSAIAFVEHSAFTTIGKGKGNVVAWLKSLKDRYTWKPSKREKEALLWCVVHLGGADKQTLGELLEALNKL